MPTTQGRIIPNNSSEAVSVLEVWVKPTLDTPYLLIEFNTGSGIAHNVVETNLMQGFDGGEISRLQDKGGLVECDFESPQQNRFHVTAIRHAP